MPKNIDYVEYKCNSESLDKIKELTLKLEEKITIYLETKNQASYNTGIFFNSDAQQKKTLQEILTRLNSLRFLIENDKLNTETNIYLKFFFESKIPTFIAAINDRLNANILKQDTTSYSSADFTTLPSKI